ncbi:MAG: hypothetical protein IT204_14240 [Fimbriimonadaceae bacterium]|nr:hypothetical protein [Fimbriimonadaceae bacterium]
MLATCLALLTVVATPRLETVWDGLATCDPSRAIASSAAELRRPGRAAGVQRPAVFLHPRDASEARLPYTVALPALGAEDRLVLCGWAGYSDGIGETPAHDGIGVGFKVEGQRLAHQHLADPGWAPLLADLRPYAGRSVTVELVTDSGGGGDINYDWALVGEPRIVLLRGNAADARGVAPLLAGGALLQAPAGAAGPLRIQALGAAGQPLGEPLTAPLTAAGQAWLEFDFCHLAGAVAVRAELVGGLAQELRLAGPPTQLALRASGPRQGVVAAGQPTALGAVVENTGRAPLAAGQATVQFSGAVAATRPVPPLAPGQTAAVSVPLAPRAQAGEVGYDVALRWLDGETPQAVARPGQVTIRPALPPLPATVVKAPVVQRAGDAVLLASPRQRLVLLQNGRGVLRCEVATARGYRLVAQATQVAEVELAAGPAPLGVPEIRTTARSVRLSYPLEGAPARLVATWTLAADDLIDLDLELTASAPVALRALRGPAVLVGDGSSGAAKQQALFPGLEYLQGAEPSSSTRDFHPPLNNRLVPDPHKVTVPLLAVQTADALVALLWDAGQTWHANHHLPSALFASPNHLDQQDNHRLQLFAPGGPEFCDENQLTAREPYAVPAGETVTLRQTWLLRAGAKVLDAVDVWCARRPTFAQANPQPRPLPQQLALSRWAFQQTVWEPTTKKSRHCIGWEPANSPQYAALLLTDALLTSDPAGAAAAREHAQTILDTTLAEQGEGGLASPAGCHILRGNLPFVYGHLDGALPALRAAAYQSIGSMAADGSWGYSPPPGMEFLGPRGTRELGTCAVPAQAIWRWARLTGDPEAIGAGRRALAYLDRFVVPAGAQGWECPIHQPDVLAAAAAIRCYVDAYRTTGEQRWRDRAVYWARSGLPFIYLWEAPGKPGMKHASIPVFGSTWFTHSWLGVPVQWCGLVYAYALRQLAAIDHSRPWQELAWGITVSGMIQQFGDEEPRLKGCYPDGWYERFTKRNPPYINPEDIDVNYYAQLGWDLAEQTVTAQLGSARYRLSSGAKIDGLVVAGDTLRCRLTRPAGGRSCTMLPGIAAPRAVTLDGRPAKFGDDLDAAGVEARYDPRQATLFVRLEHGAAPVSLAVSGLRPGQPQAAPAQRAWHFDQGPGEWSADHHCTLAGAAGLLRCTVTGSDAYCSTATAAFEARRYGYLVVRARQTSGNSLALFWGSHLTPGTAAGRELSRPLPPDGQWHTLVFDLRQHPQWRGQINLLRLDPDPSDRPVGGVLEIDWIEARATPER